ncbi:stressosome-associated protein Prli42 [Neobacillus sp. 179-C4.2 HS]|uniref:Stressosome-associated protein Prli42 n=1 Tax=Neobacillus driksii TaxID=3035913 RepID=A0ABV4YMF9_9BACI|nr:MULTISPECIES: stressosome-associated protein Prli42 [Neobacillus]MDP5193335.1 stressosome-associated protein Prli42 [Neobacillus sp. 179.-C4.2 HS]
MLLKIKGEPTLINKKTRKIVVYLMLIAMLASTLLIGIAQFI